MIEHSTKHLTVGTKYPVIGRQCTTSSLLQNDRTQHKTPYCGAKYPVIGRQCTTSSLLQNGMTQPENGHLHSDHNSKINLWGNFQGIEPKELGLTGQNFSHRNSSGQLADNGVR